MTLTTELKTLAECEIVIQEGLNTFVEVGNALLTIRDGRLYKDRFSTFQEYCEERWNMSRIHAHRLIESASVVENLLPTGNKPSSERQIRPLANQPPEVQQAAWAEATATKPNPTAKEVHAALDKVTRKEPSVPTPVKIDPLFQVLLRQTVSKFTPYLKQYKDNDNALMEIEGIIAGAKLLIEITV